MGSGEKNIYGKSKSQGCSTRANAKDQSSVQPLLPFQAQNMYNSCKKTIQLYCEKNKLQPSGYLCKNITVVCRWRISPEDFTNIVLEHIFRTMFLFSNRHISGSQKYFVRNKYHNKNSKLPQKSVLYNLTFYSLVMFS